MRAGRVGVLRDNLRDLHESGFPIPKELLQNADAGPAGRAKNATQQEGKRGAWRRVAQGQAGWRPRSRPTDSGKQHMVHHGRGESPPPVMDAGLQKSTDDMRDRAWMREEGTVVLSGEPEPS